MCSSVSRSILRAFFLIDMTERPTSMLPWTFPFWISSGAFEYFNIPLSRTKKRLCQPFKGHFLFFSIKPSCLSGFWTLVWPIFSPSIISQLSASLERRIGSGSSNCRLTEGSVLEEAVLSNMWILCLLSLWVDVEEEALLWVGVDVLWAGDMPFSSELIAAVGLVICTEDHPNSVSDPQAKKWMISQLCSISWIMLD